MYIRIFAPSTWSGRPVRKARPCPMTTDVELGESRPVSRVLFKTAIHLGLPSPTASSNLPEPNAGRASGFLFGLAPGGVYHATDCYQPRGALLPHPFTLTGAHQERLGGLLSAALVVDSHPPGVTWHPALWSPDFPPHNMQTCVERLLGRLSGRRLLVRRTICKP